MVTQNPTLDDRVSQRGSSLPLERLARQLTYRQGHQVLVIENKNFRTPYETPQVFDTAGTGFSPHIPREYWLGVIKERPVIDDTLEIPTNDHVNFTDKKSSSVRKEGSIAFPVSGYEDGRISVISSDREVQDFIRSQSRLTLLNYVMGLNLLHVSEVPPDFTKRFRRRYKGRQESVMERLAEFHAQLPDANGNLPGLLSRMNALLDEAEMLGVYRNGSFGPAERPDRYHGIRGNVLRLYNS